MAGRTWRNWHETVSVKAHKVVDVWNAPGSSSTQKGYNDTSALLQSLIGDAIRDGVTIRATGGTWSLSDVAAGDGMLVNTRPLNYRFTFSRNQLHSSYPNPVANLLFVQCGMSIADLNVYLAQRGQCLHTSGASNGQTIAGAMSTGTHGAAVDYGSIPDFIRGLHIIVSPDHSVWLERASQPILLDATAKAFAREILRDDAVFDAALINLGGMGIVHGVLLETADRFYLHGDRWRVPYGDRLSSALDSLDFSTLGLRRPASVRPYHSQVLINPYDPVGGTYLTVMYRDQAQGDLCRPPMRSGLTQGDSALEVIGALSDLDGRLSSRVVSTLLGLSYGEYKDVCGTPGEIFRDTTTRGRVGSTAMGLPIGSVRRAVELVLPHVAKSGAPALVALRYVHGRAGRLAVAAHEAVTCVLEIDGPYSKRMARLYEDLWASLDQAGIRYTFHCGKMNNLSSASIGRRFGDATVNGWKTARGRLLSSAPLRDVFANDFLRRTSLHGP